MELNKQLQNKIGSIIGKDYFKLEFGTEVVIEGQHYRVLDDFIHLAKISPMYKTCEEVVNIDLDDLIDTAEILGQEPTLNDVLLAIQEKISALQPTHIKNLVCIWTKKAEPIYIDLEKSIFNQSEEVKVALINLLENK